MTTDGLLPAGQAAPPFRLTAVTHKRVISLDVCDDVPLLLAFAGYQTATPARELLIVVRKQYPDPAQVLAANVLDLRQVPRLLRGAARQVLQEVYRQAASEVPDGFDPEDHLLFLPDWDGKTFAAYQVEDTSRELALFLIDRERQIRANYQGENAETAVLQMLAEITE